MTCRAISDNQFVDPKTLLTKALRVSPTERAALAGELIESLETEIDPDADAAWSEEIRARVAQLDGSTAKTISWPGVAAESTRRLDVARVLSSPAFLRRLARGPNGQDASRQRLC